MRFDIQGTAYTSKTTESVPAYPLSGDGLSGEASAPDEALVWGRIESYIAWRWVTRDVEWIVQGPGRWAAPLTPHTIASIEIWDDTTKDWIIDATALEPSPFGLRFLKHGLYRVTGTAGDDSAPPAIVTEAYRRLAEYFTADAGTAGADREDINIGGLSQQIRRDPAWLGAALQNSGAADLLRRYRRVT